MLKNVMNVHLPWKLRVWIEKHSDVKKRIVIAGT